MSVKILFSVIIFFAFSDVYFVELERSGKKITIGKFWKCIIPKMIHPETDQNIQPATEPAQ